MKALSKVVAVIALSLVPLRLFALGTAGFANEAAGAKALGAFNAVVAQADDPTAVYFNPAGITQLDGLSLSLNDDILDIHMQHESRSGTKTNAESDYLHVPSAFAVYKKADQKIAYGAAVHSTFGLETRWGSDSFAKYSATLSRFHLVTFNPTVAFAPTNRWSIGAGLDFVRAYDVDLRKRINVSAINGVSSPDGESRQYGDGNGVGANVGLLVKLHPQHQIGISYRSAVKIDIDGAERLSGLSGPAAFVFGGGDYSTGSHASITLPPIVTVGYAFRPTPAWVVEADTQWTGWSSVDNFHERFDEADPTRRAILDAGVDPKTREWQDNVSVGVGSSYDFTSRWTGRLGLGYLPRAVPEKTFDPALPDADRIEATTGVSCNLKSIKIHIGYNAAFFRSRSVSNSVAGGTIDGTYRTFVNSYSVGVEERF